LSDDLPPVTGLTLDLVGSPAIVTGAGQGLGYDTARHLMAPGADVLVFELDGARAEEAARSLNDSQPNRRALAFAGDISREDDVRAAFDLAVEELGVPRILVNNALYNLLSPIVALPVDEWQRVYDVVARGTFLGTREFGRRAMEHKLAGGAIVNISTLNYSIATTGLSAYCSSKAAVSQFTKAAALEYAQLGIRVNAIAPGLIDTPLARRFLGDQPDVEQAFIDLCPLDRVGTTADMARRGVPRVAGFRLDHWRNPQRRRRDAHDGRPRQLVAHEGPDGDAGPHPGRLAAAGRARPSVVVALDVERDERRDHAALDPPAVVCPHVLVAVQAQALDAGAVMGVAILLQVVRPMRLIGAVEVDDVVREHVDLVRHHLLVVVEEGPDALLAVADLEAERAAVEDPVRREDVDDAVQVERIQRQAVAVCQGANLLELRGADVNCCHFLPPCPCVS
jgi:glucose 1-dehydrogenase